jgi:hypothetical protein
MKLFKFPISLLCALLFFSGEAPSADPAQPLLIPDRITFSPNSDGVLDSVHFSVSDPDNRFAHPKRWEIQIESRTGRFIRRFTSDHRLIRPPRSIQNLFLPGALEARALQIFSGLEWDGRDEHGNFVEDGLYSVKASFITDDGSIQNTPPVEISVDTIRPELTASCTEKLILRRRDKDGKLSPPSTTASIEQRSSSILGIEYTGSVLNEEGLEMERRTWKDRLPEKIIWNGKRGDGLYAPPGRYTYSLTARDIAGNSATIRAHSIWIQSEIPALFIECGECLISPRRESGNETLHLQLERYGGERRDPRKWRWQLKIMSKDQKRELDLLNGEGFPDSIAWPVGRLPEDGREGLFYAHLSFTFEDGTTESASIPFRSDGTPPSIELTLDSDDYFTPDGDGEDERLRIRMKIEDLSGIASYSLSIVNQPGSDLPARKIFRTLNGFEVPEVIEWNGSGDDGDVTASFENYYIEITAVDRAGNRIKREALRFRSGLLFRSETATAERLIARIPIQRYFTPQGGLTEEFAHILNRLTASLSRYGHYRIEIETHMSNPGREEENLRISEIRSHEIFRALIDAGMRPEDIRYRGLGESEPLHVEEANGFERYRNERIEIHLKR